jgi:hypothetical protein
MRANDRMDVRVLQVASLECGHDLLALQREALLGVLARAHLQAE